MLFKKSAQISHGSLITFYILYLAYIVNDTFFKSNKIQESLWELIKFELFYLDGACLNCAKCCRYIDLNIFEKQIKNRSDYNREIKNHSLYKRFKPVFEDDGSIACFCCSWLDAENKCSNYEGRLPLCRNYPLSSFILDDYTYDYCGFKIARKNINPKINNLSLKKRVEKVKKLNNLLF
jgi:Fe-S-cluster containining protein